MEYRNFREFYPAYLAEHRDPACRRLHFAGSGAVLLIVGVAVVSRNAWWLLAAPVIGYGFAWVGHFFFEHNRPATFHSPLYSFLGDWRMFLDMLTRRIPF